MSKRSARQQLEVDLHYLLRSLLRLSELALEAQLENLASELTDAAVHVINSLEQLGQKHLQVPQLPTSPEDAPQEELPF